MRLYSVCGGFAEKRLLSDFRNIRDDKGWKPQNPLEKGKDRSKISL